MSDGYFTKQSCWSNKKGLLGEFNKSVELARKLTFNDRSVMLNWDQTLQINLIYFSEF